MSDPGRRGVDVVRADLIHSFSDRGEPERDADKLLAEAERLHDAARLHVAAMPWSLACALTIRAAVAQAIEARRIHAR